MCNDYLKNKYFLFIQNELIRLKTAHKTQAKKDFLSYAINFFTSCRGRNILIINYPAMQLQ